MLDIFGDFSAHDPASTLAEASTGCPYRWEPETSALYAFRAADVEKALTSEDFWSERTSDPRVTSLAEPDRARRAELKHFLSLWPVFSDGDRHGRLRRAAIRLLRDTTTPELLTSCQQLAEDRLRETGEATFDWMERIARPLAHEVITALTGRAAASELVELGGTVMNELATPRLDMARIDAALDAAHALRDWLRTALADPPTACVAGLSEVWDDAEFGPDTATALLTQIVTGAYDPLVTTLCVAGERATRALSGPLSRRAVREEIFRLATPFRFASRYALRQVEVGTHHLDAGDRIVLCLGTANFDPDYYPRPLELRERGGNPRSFSFGAGEHYCPGAPLAHSVVDALLTALRRLDVEFVTEKVEREPEFSMLRYRALEGRLTPSGRRPSAA
ncbi:cytochrome P450 [Streptomyces sp. AJS327]|uniref:cytochrome P450 n=1 Tax=Streptomyces sp. AJS327 TaxID=2545265 RepID=UPI0015E00A18|nr:cytochrome P450 [Streptomyces sp. AJS327]MBA0051253.1 cytochrome P450 [Streptomyces sp. AJS327]